MRDKSLGLPEWQKNHKTASYHFSPQVNIMVHAHQIRDIKLTDPIHFLWRAGDPSVRYIMDAPQWLDGPAAVCKFAKSGLDLNFMQLSSIHCTKLSNEAGQESRFCYCVACLSPEMFSEIYLFALFSWKNEIIWNWKQHSKHEAPPNWQCVYPMNTVS